MKKIRFLLSLIALLMAVTLLLSFAACKKNDQEFPEDPDEPPAHTNNEVASYFYGYSLKHQQLFRYDFNAAGRPLGAVAVDWYTLQPCKNLQGSAYDRHYEYDHNGRLIGHEIGGAPLSIEYDELGNPVRSVGFSRVGGIVTVEYTCGEQGDILSERVTQHAPTVAPTASQITVYTYDEDGRLTQEDHHAYFYEENCVSFEILYKGYYHTAIMNWNEKGDVVSLTFSKMSDLSFPGQKFLYEWMYDVDGRCVTSGGNTFDSPWSELTECLTVWDENGRLIEADIDVENGATEPSRVDRRYLLAYDEKGNVKESIMYYLKDGKYTTRFTDEFVDGVRVRSSQDRYGTDESGNEKIFPTFVNEYDAVTGKNVKSSNYSKNELEMEWIAEYDTLGRLVVSVREDYRSEMLYQENRTEYEYGEKEDVVKKKILQISFAMDRYDSLIYEYENDVAVRLLFESESTLDGKRVRTVRDNQLDPKTEATVHRVTKIYEDGILTEEEEMAVDYLSEHEWNETFDKTVYTDGKVSLKVSQKDLDDGRSVTLEKQYENDILILDKTTRKEPGTWREGERVYYTRPTSETFVYYAKDGSFDRREEWEYAYHDNGYRSEVLCQTYDEDGKLKHYKMETYDEAGNLISAATT